MEYLLCELQEEKLISQVLSDA